jgi:hypothetical protein
LLTALWSVRLKRRLRAWAANAACFSVKFAIGAYCAL